MKNFVLVKKLIPFLLVLLVFSCKPREELVYYQNIDGLASSDKRNSYEIKIQPDDMLMIIVSAEDPESALPFNLTAASVPTTMGSNAYSRIGQESLQTYLVDAAGTIDFPVLGQLKVAGLSRSELMQLLESKISKYIKNPIINIRLTNFKVSVQGEVTNPGTFAINSDRVTLIEAISMAKDLTIYGKRDNILIIREVNGVKSYNRVDLTKADFINSPFYYLAQNDVVYVEPNKVRINGAAVGSNTGVIISVTSLVITLITLIVTAK
ncbi:polysaccharide biosynthesis/export family protein [Flavobacterium nackdongense]|uniref:Polysaccharide export protein n=1 Tax=Flavobacterium nackdongense TaxID=2547394 RepID=A0A4P6Y9W4_9FLAO|nr:polysaccharide biosynthesis/export family protein [Flavobacterium nackdongense]QBN19809.1 polysaccharide export protein [Flavobacterium nackdongense]